MNNPVSNEIDVLLYQDDPLEEGHDEIYGVINNSIITLSSIREPNIKKGDWLTE